MLPSKIHAHLVECGTDEAGRGCLAGPVTAAAVILPDDYQHPLLNDSNQLSAKKRALLRSEIEQVALAFHVVHVPIDEIDQINILNASIAGMHRSIDGLELRPEFIAVDGNRFKPYSGISYECVVKGDGKYQHIAAASILAKTYRDEFMARLHEEFPMYLWNKNKGYPTAEHRAAIKKFGPSPHHRKSFRLLPGQLQLDF